MSGHAAHAAIEAAQLSEVAPGVYSYVQPDGTWFINNTGFVVGSDAVVSIDATSTERRTRAYLDAIASVTPNPVTILVNTHHHADHTHGNYLFTDATVVSHTACREVMVCCRHPRLQRSVSRRGLGQPAVPRAGRDVRGLDGAAPRRPSHRAVGPGLRSPHRRRHRRVAARLPGAVLRRPDLPRRHALRAVRVGVRARSRRWMSSRAIGADVIVPGHGPHFGGDDIARVLDEQRSYLRFVQESGRRGDSQQAGRRLSRPRPPTSARTVATPTPSVSPATFTSPTAKRRPMVTNSRASTRPSWT